MSANSYEYKLLGFSPELDWRPLRFVSPLPPAMICSVCRLVHRTTCYLLCGHLLCIRCYQRCRVDDALVCPLDSNVCPEDDVLWRNFPLESLARAQLSVSLLHYPSHRHSTCAFGLKHVLCFLPTI
ncbi:hypothetical protein HPB48_000611 [Haemaphysalis longicornis]|uniref:RING-type domain-containing protein n=1 Tax=Haemaphysalis longicornis TaxID=44386 RepID=A0A9J6H0P8_HAELO|nr:hypothetical protein HPB48_000611 [Haemaphysalis longicornis]